MEIDIYDFDNYKQKKQRNQTILIFLIIFGYIVFCTVVFWLNETQNIEINLQTLMNNGVDFEAIFAQYPNYINPINSIAAYMNFDEAITTKAKTYFIFLSFAILIFAIHISSKKNNRWKNIEHGSASWATNLDRIKYKLNYKFEMIYKIKPLKYILKEIKEDIEKINFSYRKQKNIKKEKIEELKIKEKEIKTNIKKIKEEIKSNISINNEKVEELKKEIDRPLKEKIVINMYKNKYSDVYFSNIEKIINGSKIFPKYSEVDFIRNIILSDTEFLPIDDRAIFRNLNILVVGGSGAGKSRNFVKPNILAASLNMVLTDPKGELYQDTHKYLEEAGYKTYQLNLNELEKSNKYNPFKYIRKDSDINIMVDTLIKNTNEKGNSGDFWEKSEKALFMALAHYLYQEYKEKINDNMQANLPTLRDILNLTTELRDLNDVEKSRAEFQFLKYEDLSEEYKIITEKLDYKYRYKNENERIKMIKKFIVSNEKEWEVISKNIENFEYEIKKVSIPIIAKLKVISEFIPRHPAKVFFDTYNLGEEKVKSSIKISLAVRLAFIGDEALSELVSNDEFDLDNVEEKRAIYVIMSDSNSAFNALAGLFFSQLFQVLYYNADKRPSKRLPLHYQFYLDEFANIGQINSFSEILATCRGRRIGIVPIVQALSQLEKLYEKNALTIQGNCDTFLYLGGNDVETMEKLSKMIGNTTVDTERQTQGRTFGNSASSSRNDNINATGRPLITPDEIKKLPDSKSIIMIRGFKPFLSNKLNVDEYYKELEIMKYVRKNVLINESKANLKDKVILEKESKEEITQAHKENIKKDIQEIIQVPKEDIQEIIQVSKESKEEITQTHEENIKEDIQEIMQVPKEDKEEISQAHEENIKKDIQEIIQVSKENKEEITQTLKEIKISNESENEKILNNWF